MHSVLVSSRSFGNVVSIGTEVLREAGFDVRRIAEGERPLDAGKLASIVAREAPEVLIAGAEPVTEGVLAATDSLRMVMKHGVGVDNIDLDAATARRIAVANAPGTNTEAVADLAVCLMLSLLRHVCAADRSTHSGGWERYIGHELGAMIVGIVGTGRIGAAVARRVRAFGATILGYDVVRDERLVSSCDLTYVPLEELLRRSDVVTLHAPLNADTRDMLASAELARMKPSSILINCARGELVDETALYEHLSAGRIAGAAVDVFATEPPQQSRLVGLGSVLATPHIGAYTREAMEAMDRLCAETIIAVLLHGRSLPNLLNPKVGT